MPYFQCPEGIVACAKNTLRVLSLENLGSVFNSKSTPLRMTPRDFVVDPSVTLSTFQNGLVFYVFIGSPTH